MDPLTLTLMAAAAWMAVRDRNNGNNRPPSSTGVLIRN